MNLKMIKQFFTKSSLLLAIVLYGFSTTINAQQGAFLISKHSPAGNNNLYFDVVISKKGGLYVASKNGIIKYDGTQSKIIDTGGAVLSVFNTPQNRVYAGGVGGFGYILSDSYSELYQPIFDQENTVILDVFYYNNRVYAISENTFYVYNLNSEELTYFTDEVAGQFYQIFEIENKIFISTENKGVIEFFDNRLATTDMKLFQDMDISFVDKSVHSSKYLIGTYSNELFLYDGELTPIIIEDEFINKNNISCASWYDDDQIVVGSAFGGIGVISIGQKKLLNEINYKSGLKANDIKSIIVDENGSIISLSDDLIEYVSVKVPIMNFAHYNGLQGTIQAVSFFNKKLFVSTNRGLFSLNKRNNYEDQSYLVQSVLQKRINVVDNKNKKRLSRKERKNSNELAPQILSDSVITKLVKQKVLLSSHFEYEKIEKIHHSDQLISGDNNLIVSGLSGVFEITSNEVVNVTSEPIYYTYLSDDNRLIFACGDNQVFTFFKENGKWIQKDILTDFKDNISHIIEYNNDYWLCGIEKVHKLNIDRKELIDVEILPLSNPYFDQIFAYTRQEALYFVSKNNQYKLTNDSIVSDGKISAELVVLDNRNTLWVKENSRWYQPHNNLYDPIFSAISNINSVFVDESNDRFWMISSDQRILKYNKNKALAGNSYLPYLEAIHADKTSSKGVFKVEQQNSKLSFYLSHPDLSRFEVTEYRHKLTGLNTGWSNWSTNDLIEFPFLPTGDYKLEIESKSPLGKTHELSPISFSVVPPFWKEPIFYFLEFVVIVLLLIVSIKIRSWGSHFGIISKLLAFLVLAIILEGLEAILESYFNLESSPFFSFSLQVMTALILFPLEGIFRKYILPQKNTVPRE